MSVPTFLEMSVTNETYCPEMGLYRGEQYLFGWEF